MKKKDLTDYVKTKKDFVEVDIKKKNINTLNLVKPKAERHKYKYEKGKKSYTFKSKKDLCDSMNVPPSVANKLIKGENPESKIKISLI